MKACVIIPTLNEEENIGGLVSELRAKELDVLVIDDGSEDKTSEAAENAGAKVIRNARNLGKGASLKIGFDNALSGSFDAVITMDGDGQHCANDIDKFIGEAEKNGAEIIIGNRMSDASAMPPLRYMTNKLMSWGISGLTGQRIPDSQCGFRLFIPGVLKNVKLGTSKYETESEILIRASKMGYRIRSIPIKTLYFNRKSQINPFVDTLRFFRFLFSELFR